MISRGLKAFFLFSLFGAIAITLVGGWYTLEAAPPYPTETVDDSGAVLSTKENLLQGQMVWQKYGLMDNGSVWGHGTYRGNDYTATTLHLIGQFMRAQYAQEKFNGLYENLSDDQEAAVDRGVIQELKTNRLDQDTLRLRLTKAEAVALTRVRAHWDRVFSKGDLPTAVSPNVIKAAEERQNLADFFFWTAWAAGTLRPGKALTYTNNWPPDRSVGNEIAPEAVVWSIASLLGLMVALGGAILFFFKGNFDKDLTGMELDDRVGEKLINLPITSSQRKTAKYFLVVMLLFFLQLMQGGLLAHYTVHPGEFYGIKAVSDHVPYNWPKSWHLQLAIFWIATAWVGAAIYLAPIAGRKEPRWQGLLVDVLFGAVVFVVAGSLLGSFLGVKGLAGKHWFWIGHQGWEFLESGRLWQILLLVGLVIWLYIVARAIISNFGKGQDRWGTVPFYTYSAIAIVSFFAFGLFYSPRTHITIADFWRWWVVHTWVEGIFEFFAAAAMAYVVTTLGLAPKQKALRAAYLTASLAMFSGIIGVGHHYYWFGDPDLWLALGGVVSTMEPVPIILLLVKVALDARHSPAANESFPYKWPVMFMGASSAWAFLGAGVFGFIITTPMVNYYEHSTYLTMNHGHTALFGTYGMLAIGLMLFALRGLIEPKHWNNTLLKLGFIGTNFGLLLMALFTLMPVGFMQAWDSFENGLWHARSPEFYNLPLVRFIGQWRLIPDLIIIAGALCLVLFVIRAMRHLKPATVAEEELILIPDAEHKPGRIPASRAA
ncbi:MAG: cbb3-type cytochrome c oxidase subunit I [Candidatus Hydrogenedentes bacterium]|nr:cbb3-type cytochrome c oxidase subunit I [Candidatus Hydrogenedentota bacterium]